MASIAIVGASTDRSKYGNKAVRAFVQGGWTVYPVTPKAETVEGLTAYKSIADVPGHLDRISLYVPPAVALEMIDQIAARKPVELFLNPGAESDALVQAAKERGLEPVLACSVVNIGLRPDMFPDE